MARQLRIEYEGAFYHITSWGDERRKIFFTKNDYEKFKEYLSRAKEKYNYRLHCYMLMTNHYHLLIETSDGNGIRNWINRRLTQTSLRPRLRRGRRAQTKDFMSGRSAVV